MEDWELSDYYCPKCNEQLAIRDCDRCEDGIIDLYDEDPSWYDEDDIMECPDCEGEGCFIWCRNENCDVTSKEIEQAVKEQSKEFELGENN